MTLRDQILARIDETPHRPPTLRDILIKFEGCQDAADAEIVAMVRAKIIDTETGDSGVTYRKAKPPHNAPTKAEFKPQHESIAPWPKRSRS